jgi:elongation factor Ts
MKFNDGYCFLYTWRRKIGVLVDLKAGNAATGLKILQCIVAATNPAYLNRTQVPADVLEHEKEVLSEQARNEGKPDKIIEKMVMGRIQKYLQGSLPC